jgi:lambda family phage portal protein
MSFIDNMIGLFSPKAEFRRQQYRIATEALRSYEAASRTRRTAGWKTTSASANEETKGALTTIRNRQRDLFRNNPYASRAINGLADNLVGTGIRPSPLGATKTVDKRIKQLWRQWANKTKCDYDGKHNFYGLQRLAAKTLFESGEVLIVKRRVADRSLPIPMQLQVLEPDYIDSSKDYMELVEAGGAVIQGVEYNTAGKRVAYWLYDRHPGDGWAIASKRVPVEDVLHVYPVDRPGQVRGVPVGTSSIMRLRDFDEYEDAQLLKQKVSACFAAFVTDDANSNPVGGSDQDQLERLEPGIIEYLAPGKQVTFANPPSVEGYDVYARTILRAIAAGYGVTYEMMTGDLSNVNFSSGRMGWLEFHRLITRMQELVFIPQMCDPCWDWFMEACVVSMQFRPAQVVDAEWTSPRREMIDPSKEVKAQIESIKGGITSWSEVARENGWDRDELLAQMSKDKEDLDALEIVVNSDFRKDPNYISAVNKGKVQSAQTSIDDEEDDDEEDDTQQNT